MKKSTASKKLIRVIVERHEDGTYWGTTQNIPGVVSAYGSRLEILKSNIEAAFKDYLVLATEEGYDWVLDFKSGVQWEYKMNIQAFFALIPEVKISAIGKKAGINESLMRQYARGTAAVSEARMKQIEKCIQTLGRELCAVSF